ncbi:hypothetical protein ThvES_00014420 [Thiovulum sp. ES]|nr:hypothetical protein ThvES_00014420 [Thiovulum sp. ES]
MAIFKVIFLALFSTLYLFSSDAVSRDLKYPSGTPSALEIMKNVYYVNHFYAFKNYSIDKKRRNVTVIVKKSAGEKPLTETVTRYLNNSYSDGVVQSKDLAIFHSGKNKGLGMLITDYVDDDKSQLYLAWIPALRKIRRFAQPAHEDAWGGTAFTFGDVTLRKPRHETHSYLGKEKFAQKTGAIELKNSERRGYLRRIPSESDKNIGKEVYKVKSTTKFSGWWYDYRISFVDTETFGDYRVEYYKGGKLVKILDKYWGSFKGTRDPRALKWGFWYAKDMNTGFESMAYIPNGITKVNQKLPASKWSEGTLKKIKR